MTRPPPFLLVLIALATPLIGFSATRVERYDGVANEELQQVYVSRVRGKIMEELNKFRLPEDLICTLHVDQMPGGEVIGARFNGCGLFPDQQEQISRRLVGVKLPYQGFESVFRRELVIHFYPHEP